MQNAEADPGPKISNAECGGRPRTKDSKCGMQRQTKDQRNKSEVVPRPEGSRILEPRSLGKNPFSHARRHEGSADLWAGEKLFSLQIFTVS